MTNSKSTRTKSTTANPSTDADAAAEAPQHIFELERGQHDRELAEHMVKGYDPDLDAKEAEALRATVRPALAHLSDRELAEVIAEHVLRLAEGGMHPLPPGFAA